MQRRLLLLLLLSFLFCYFEWGERSAFLFQIEWVVMRSPDQVASNFSHPAVLVTLLGQVLMLVCLFLRRPPRALVLTAIALMGLLVLLILLAGVLGQRPLMALSCLPFVGLALVYTLRRANRISRSGL
jgi:hypothetical protein